MRGFALTPFDARREFEPAADEVRDLAVQGAGATVFSGGLGLAIQMMSTVILARLLTPRDFGVVTMVTTFSLLFTNFGLNGFTEAVLQREKIDHALASNLFWINLGSGLLLTLGFAAAGSLLARFYRDPLVLDVTRGVSLTILLTSISVIHLALLKRALRFPVVSANDIVGRTLSVGVSIVLGWAGLGYWALVAGAITLPLVQSIGAWYLCRWVPGLPRRVPGTLSMVRFALHVYGRFSVNYFTGNMDNLLVGWSLGARTLGFYKKAYDLFALSAGLTTASLTNVAVSALSRLKQKPVEYKWSVLGALAVMAFLGMGLGAILTLVGRDVIRLMLGSRWAESGRIFSFFGPGIGMMLVYYAHGWIHLSIGRPDRWFRWGLLELGVTGLLLVLGLRWGPQGIALAWTLSFWMLTIPAFWYAGKPAGIDVGAVVGAIWRYICAAVLAGFGSAAILRGFPSLASMSGAVGSFERIMVTSTLFGTLYLAGVVLLHGGLSPILQVTGLLKEMVPWAAVLSYSPRNAATPSLTQANHPLPVAAEGCSTVRGTANSEPLVSILIPAYNAQEWIGETLRSALAQTWGPKEIIVVDDGSTDQTLARARQFESEGVRVVTKKNEGAAAARNVAFSFSRGDYIQWLDADDILAPDKISRQMEAVNQFHNKRMLFSSPWGIFMHRYHRAEFIPTSLWCDLSPTEWLLRKMWENVYMQTATWLVSRELTEAAGVWDTRLLSDDDGEYFCRVLLASDGVRFVHDAKVYYRGPGLAFRSLSYIGQSQRKLEALWLSMQLHVGYLRSLEDSPRARAACLKYLQTSLLYFYPEWEGIVKEAEQLARECGGQLAAPRLSWKYSWMKPLFGWRLAKSGQQLLLGFRWSSERLLDKALLDLERARLGLVREHGSGAISSRTSPGNEDSFGASVSARPR